jgi:hypothetical protein
MVSTRRLERPGGGAVPVPVALPGWTPLSAGPWPGRIRRAAWSVSGRWAPTTDRLHVLGRASRHPPLGRDSSRRQRVRRCIGTDRRHGLAQAANPGHWSRFPTASAAPRTIGCRSQTAVGLARRVTPTPSRLHRDRPPPSRSSPDQRAAAAPRAPSPVARSTTSTPAPALSSGALPLPHLGDCTHDGQRHGTRIRRSPHAWPEASAAAPRARAP